MRALVYDGAAVACVKDRPLPVPGPNESLIRISLAAICNTDREVMRGYKKDFTGILGHEFVGVVEQSPNPDMVGKRVVGELNAGCQNCLYCNTGREHHCKQRRVPGMAGKDGCFAEYMTLRTDLLHLVPDNLPDEQAVFCEPLAAALQVLEQNHLPPSQPVAVVGDGRLAYLITQVVALSGAAVTVFGRHPEKLAMFAPFAQTATQPEGSFETVIEATGKPGGLQDAIALTRSGGLLVLKSTYADLAQLDVSGLVVREITLRGSRCGPFAPALTLLSRGFVCLPQIDLYPLEYYEAAFISGAFKAGFDFR